MKLKMIDLFSGIGGIRMGFEKTEKVETVFSCEIDKNACNTYKNNFGDDPTGDITTIDPKKLPDFDLLVAGFPCQAFSIAGKQLGFKDKTRGTLFFDVIKIVDEKKPKIVFLENVKGLVRHNKGETFKTICEALKELGYDVHHKLLNAKKFNIPQKRERIYIVAIRNDIPNSNKFSFPNGRKNNKTISDILEKNVDAKYFISEQYWKTLKAHKERHKNKGNGFGYEIIDHDDIANTIVCGGMGRERNLIIDNTKPKNIENRKTKMNSENIRVMTPREWARLQGFPDSYKLPEVNGHAYKQLGNCVVIPVIHSIAKKIVNGIDNG